MDIKIKYNSCYLRYFRKNGIVLYPYVLISSSEEEARKKYILQHEWIHVQQVRKNGILKFYLRYIGEWVFNLFRYLSFSKAYQNISYEKEAYSKAKKIKLPKNLL